MYNVGRIAPHLKSLARSYLIEVLWLIFCYVISVFYVILSITNGGGREGLRMLDER
jgi:hypothetical protein